MKKYLFVLLVAFSLSAVAQDQLLEGVIASKMTMSSESPDVQAQLAMIGDINSVTYFKDNKTRTEVNNPMSGEAVNIIDSESLFGNTLINGAKGGVSFEVKPEDKNDLISAYNLIINEIFTEDKNAEQTINYENTEIKI